MPCNFLLINYSILRTNPDIAQSCNRKLWPEGGNPSTWLRSIITLGGGAATWGVDEAVLRGDPCLQIMLLHDVAPSRGATLEPSGEIPQAIDPFRADLKSRGFPSDICFSFILRPFPMVDGPGGT